MTRLYGTVAVCGSGAASGRAHSGAGHGTHPAHPPLRLWGQRRLTNGGRICVGSLRLGPGRASPRLCRPVPPSGPGGALARGRAGLLFSPRQPRVPAPDRAGGIPAAFPSPINLSPSQANSPCSELGSGARSASRSSAGASRRERGKERSAAARRAAAGRAREPRSPAEPRPDGRPRPPPPVQGPESGRSAGPGAPTGRTRAVPVGTEPGTSAPRSPGEPPALPAGRRGGSCSAAPTARFHALFFPDLLLVTGDSMRSPLFGTFPAAPRPGAAQSRPDRPPAPPCHTALPRGSFRAHHRSPAGSGEVQEVGWPHSLRVRQPKHRCLPRNISPSGSGRGGGVETA